MNFLSTVSPILYAKRILGLCNYRNDNGLLQSTTLLINYLPVIIFMSSIILTCFYIYLCDIGGILVGPVGSIFNIIIVLLTVVSAFHFYTVVITSTIQNPSYINFLNEIIEIDRILMNDFSYRKSFIKNTFAVVFLASHWMQLVWQDIRQSTSIQMKNYIINTFTCYIICLFDNFDFYTCGDLLEGRLKAIRCVVVACVNHNDGKLLLLEI